MKNRQLPTSQFQENEADRLIAAYGKKPAPEKQRDLETFLRGQKEQFRDHARQREARNGPERGAYVKQSPTRLPTTPSRARGKGFVFTRRAPESGTAL